MIQLVIAYVILCIICGLMGTRTRVGFWGVAILSILLTPILTLLFLLVLKEPAPKAGAK